MAVDLCIQRLEARLQVFTQRLLLRLKLRIQMLAIGGRPGHGLWHFGGLGPFAQLGAHLLNALLQLMQLGFQAQRRLHGVVHLRQTLIHIGRQGLEALLHLHTQAGLGLSQSHQRGLNLQQSLALLFPFGRLDAGGRLLGLNRLRRGQAG